MSELSKLRQFPAQFLRAEQGVVDGPVEVSLLEGLAGAERLGVLQEEDGLGVEGLQGGEEDDALLSEHLLHRGVGGGQAGHSHGALGGTFSEMVRGVQPHLGPLGLQAGGQSLQGKVGLTHSAESEVAGVLTV